MDHDPVVGGQAEEAGQHDAGHHERAGHGDGPDPAGHRVADAAAEGDQEEEARRGAAAA